MILSSLFLAEIDGTGFGVGMHHRTSIRFLAERQRELPRGVLRIQDAFRPAPANG